jgi:hypothetical protein
VSSRASVRTGIPKPQVPKGTAEHAPARDCAQRWRTFTGPVGIYRQTARVLPPAHISSPGVTRFMNAWRLAVGHGATASPAAVSCNGASAYKRFLHAISYTLTAAGFGVANRT